MGSIQKFMLVKPVTTETCGFDSAKLLIVGIEEINE
jgi:hypothetical protein